MRRPAALALALFGLFDSLYLWWVYASPSHPMLCLGSGCDVVRASPYAHLFGLPTPVYGVLLYAALAVLIYAEPLVPEHGIWLRRMTALLAGAGFLTAAWLTGIEAFVLHAWCAWCVSQAIAVTLIFILSLSLVRDSGYPDAAGALKIVRWHSAVLLAALIAGAPAMAKLMSKAELPAAPPPSTSTVAERLVRPDSHVTGDPQAAVSFVEFGDFQCPSCVAAEPTNRELRRRFGDRVRFVFRHFPLEKIHEYALRAAEASECAANQGKFWQAVERLYNAKGELDDASLARYAGEIGLDTGRFNACLASGETLPRIRRDAEDARALGVRGTPTYFLNERRIEGSVDVARFEQLLSGQPASPAPPPQPAAAPPATPSQPAKNTSTATAAGFGGSTNPFLNVQGPSTDCTEDAPTGPEPEMIHTTQAEQLFRDKSLFVDVRSADDFQKARIAGAVNIPLNEATRRATELPRDRTIVLYEGGSGSPADVCAASRAVGRVLLARGYRKVLVYQDGLAGWQKQSLPVER